MHAVLAWSSELRQPGSPLIATATLDLDIQKIAARAVRDNLRRLNWANATNSAAVVTDVTTGEILAYVGSADYFDADAKGAIDFLQTKRSPGSALKPFIYGLALEKGSHTAASEMPDVPTEFPTMGGGAYVPENMTHTFLGPMLLRQALGNSRNIPALNLLSELGVERALELFERGGVKNVDWSPDRYGLSLAIGSLHVTPLELVTLYSALANGGETRPLVRWTGREPGPRARLLSRDAAQMTTHLLADPEARRPGFPGTGSRLPERYLSSEVAPKATSCCGSESTTAGSLLSACSTSTTTRWVTAVRCSFNVFDIASYSGRNVSRRKRSDALMISVEYRCRR